MRWFKDSEFTHPDKLVEELKRRLDLFRDLLGYPVMILADWATSGHMSDSKHYLGKAVDAWAKCSILWVYMCAERAGFTGIGLYFKNGKVSFHVDVRTEGMPYSRWIGVWNGRKGAWDYLPMDEKTFRKYVLGAWL